MRAFLVAAVLMLVLCGRPPSPATVATATIGVPVAVSAPVNLAAAGDRPSVQTAACTSVAGAPPGRWFTQMAYDSLRRQTVLFGGETTVHPGGGSTVNDTWTWDGVSWTQATPRDSPPYGNGLTLAWDAGRGQVVYLSGDQTWTWDGSNWTHRRPAHSPGARFNPAMAYYPDLNGIVLFGGAQSDTWLWDGSDWTQLAGALFTDPQQLWSTMAYDGAHKSLVLAVNHQYNGVETYRWQDGRWQKVDIEPLVSAGQARMVYAPGLSALVYMDNGGQLATWDGTGWTVRYSAVDRVRTWPGMAYDAARGVVIIFGGLDASRTCPLAAMLIWDGTSFRSAAPTVVVGHWPDWNGSLWGIADRLAGDGNRWPELYKANFERIGPDPNLIFPATVLAIPSTFLPTGSGTS